MPLGIKKPSPEKAAENIMGDAVAQLESALALLKEERRRLVGPLDAQIERLDLALGALRGQRSPSVQAHAAVPDGSILNAAGHFKARPTGKTQRRVFDFIAANPSANYKDLCAAVFDGGFSDANYNNARNVIRAMKANDWIVGEPGAWVTGPGPDDPGPFNANGNAFALAG